MKILSIVGMHRSGTSLTASLIHRSGLFLGDNLMEGGFDNINGHFEDCEILEFHEKDLKKKNIDTNGIIKIPNQFLSFDSGTNLLLDSFIEKRSLKDSWGWKEPRSVLYLNAWKEKLPELKCLCVFRHYDEVVDSLLRRYKHKISKSVGISSFRSKIHLVLFPLRKVYLKRQYYRAWYLYNSLMIDYIKINPDDTLSYSLNQVLNDFDSVINEIEDKFAISLTKIDVSKVHDPKLLKTKSNNGFRWFSKKSLDKVYDELIDMTK